MTQQLFRMATSPRFRELLIYDHEAAFDEALDMQFAATTFVCPGRFAYVGYRGTDTTLTGWREDFNMAYMVPVPAQIWPCAIWRPWPPTADCPDGSSWAAIPRAATWPSTRR
jgi:hypothetical protein